MQLEVFLRSGGPALRDPFWPDAAITRSSQVLSGHYDVAMRYIVRLLALMFLCGSASAASSDCTTFRTLAEVARPQAEHVEGLINGLGTLQSITFKGVGPGGFDIYDVKFEHGSLDWRILLDADGKVAGEGLHRLP